MKRRANRSSKTQDYGKNFFANSKRKNKMNTKYMGSHMTYSGTDLGSTTYRLS